MTDIATIRDALAGAELWQIIALSLSVSLSAAAIATVLGGGALAVWRFRGRHTAILVANSPLALLE